jgi:basic membrane lipoprotein Med (substrate-binding protein (PBP1-ABC) superfamily)
MAGVLRRYWWAAAAVVAVLGIALGVLLTQSSHSAARTLPPARARVYTSFDACLLTDADGISGAQAAPVWSGMQAASLATSGKVSYLAVTGDDTAANAIPYVNTLVQRKCDLVLAVGPAQVAAARQQAAAFPKVGFVVVDGGSSAGNVTAVPPGKGPDVSAAVKGLVTKAADNVTVR